MNNIHETIQIFETELKKYTGFVRIDEVEDDPSSEELGFRVVTNSFYYSVSIQYPDGNDPGYIGAISGRIEPPHVGNDLAEAKFTKQGALFVVGDIFQYDYRCTIDDRKNELRKNVLNAATTLARKFFHDDRQEDEDLPKGEIEQAIREDAVTEQEIIQTFVEECGFTSIVVVEKDEFEAMGR